MTTESKYTYITSSANNKFQAKLTAGNGITIDTNNVISASVSGYEEYGNLDWTGLYDSSTFKVLHDLKLVFIEGTDFHIVEIPKGANTGQRINFNSFPQFSVNGNDLVITDGFYFGNISFTNSSVTTFEMRSTQRVINFTNDVPSIPSSITVSMNFTKVTSITDATTTTNNYVIMYYKP